MCFPVIKTPQFICSSLSLSLQVSKVSMLSSLSRLYYVSHLDIILVSVDGRGTGYRGGRSVLLLILVIRDSFIMCIHHFSLVSSILCLVTLAIWKPLTRTELEGKWTVIISMLQLCVCACVLLIAEYCLFDCVLSCRYLQGLSYVERTKLAIYGAVSIINKSCDSNVTCLSPW